MKRNLASKLPGFAGWPKPYLLVAAMGTGVGLAPLSHEDDLDEIILYVNSPSRLEDAGWFRMKCPEDKMCSDTALLRRLRAQTMKGIAIGTALTPIQWVMFQTEEDAILAKLNIDELTKTA